MKLVAPWCALALLAAACGGTSEVRQADVAVTSEARPVAPPVARSSAPRIAVVTHGQASSVFWSKVHNGVDAGARQLGAAVTYRSPDVYSVDRMRTLIDEAVAGRPDGLVVSLPSPDLADAVGAARAAGIPVVSINSGSDISRRLGLLAHVGQPESRAGYEAGRRLAAAGVRRALCINQEVGNEALDLRCRSFDRALQRSGGAARVVSVDFQDTPATQRKVAAAISRREIDGVLTLNTSGAEAVVDALQAAGRAGDLEIGTFDLSPKVLEAVRQGRIRFAIDQQPYMQGFLPVIMLAQLARKGVFPTAGELIATGPQFVTLDTAPQVIRLSLRGIR